MGVLIIKKLVFITLIVLCTVFVANVGVMEPGGLSTNDVINIHFIEYLYNTPEHAMVFAAELNISNGNPKTRDFGERYMFGKLITYQYVYENMEELLLVDEERIIDETVRLLVGGWYNNGNTVFSFKKLKDRKVFDFSKREWVKRKEIDAIKVEHTTEYSNKKRISYIAYRQCGDEYYFSIVR